MTDNHRKECDGPPSDYDLEKQLKAMDRFLDLHESNILRMETPVTVLNPERNFFDEFIDPIIFIKKWFDLRISHFS